MRLPLWRRTAFVLLFALCTGLWTPPPARAADEGGSNNMTLGLVAVVAVVAVVVAWKMDFGADDDMITRDRTLQWSADADDRLAVVLTDWEPADPARSEVISGIGLRAWF